MFKEIQRLYRHMYNEFRYSLAFAVGDVATFPVWEEECKEFDMLGGNLKAWQELNKRRTIARWDIEAERETQK